MYKLTQLFFVISFLTLFMVGANHAQAESPRQIGTAVAQTQPVVQAAFSGCGNETISATRNDFEQEVVRLVNERRKSRGLPPFKAESQLFDSARYHAFDMGQDNYFDHNSYDRSGDNLVEVCETFARIAKYYDFISAAENIASGQLSPTEVMTAWLNSPGHRDNIDNTSSWEIGVGYYDGSGDDAPYWVQNFGRRANVYPVVIDYDAAETDTPNISLYVYGRDTWTEIRLRNDADGWGNWQPFSADIISWTLNNLMGERTVSVQLRNGNSESAISSDTIMLTTGGSNTATPTATSTATPLPIPTATMTPTSANGNLPDLIVTSMSIGLDDNRSCGASTPLGLRVNFTNQGNAAAAAFILEINNSTQTTISGLATGASGSFWFNGVSGGEMSAVIDASAQITESNENNNTLTQMVPVPTPIPTCTPEGRPTVDSGGTPTATSTPVIRPTIDPGTATSTPVIRPTVDPGTTVTATPGGAISGVIKLQGRNDYSGVQIWGSDSACSNNYNGTILVTTNGSGQFTVTPNHGYNCLYVVKAGFILGQNSQTGGNLGTITLPAGDMNQDGVIDIFDVAYVGLRYDGSDLSADLNMDGKVNIFDIALVSGNYKKQGPLTAWQ